MMKHSIAMLVAVATTALSGCSLYFGDDHHNDGSWNYCGSDGYYECSGDECYWRGPDCPAGQPGTPVPPDGYECKTSDDCAAGCYCDNGKCEEAGFCTTDADCGNGYVCNTQRSSCEPSDPTTLCQDDAGCPAGKVCDNGTCSTTCTCATDADAKAGGYDYCDEGRGTCVAGVDPNGDCGGTVAPTCNVARPACTEGSVPTMFEGCFTGSCEVIAACATQPECVNYQFDNDCRADTSCASAYTGTNCHKPDNSPCTAGDTNCTCSNYSFASCQDKSSPRLVEYDGHYWDVSELTLRN